MKKIFTLAFILLGLAASAQTDYLKISMKDGSVQNIAVDQINEMTFGDLTQAEKLAGNYEGNLSLTVGGMFTYSTVVTVKITANADGTVNYYTPAYSLANTQMGDLSLSELTIANIPYDETKGGFYLDYSAMGYKQHFKAEKDGKVSMENDYVLGNPSTILIQKTEKGIKVTNPFKLGSMPFPLSASFESPVNNSAE